MIVLIVAVLVLAVAAMFGMGRWILDRAAIRGRLERGRARSKAPPYDPAEIRGLPPPVVRYFEAVLAPGSPFIDRATLVQEGTMTTSPSSTFRFTATQRVTVRRPGFLWEASVSGPLGLRVIDAYADGQGSFHLAALFGMLHLAGWRRVRDTRFLEEAARGQLQRWLAEGPWYPTAMLPRAGVRWEAIDERSAQATITDGLNTASLLFRFGDDARVESVYAESRGREVHGRLVPQEWEGFFTSYAERGGYVVPREGRVRWKSDPEPYWNGTIVRIDYD